MRRLPGAPAAPGRRPASLDQGNGGMMPGGLLTVRQGMLQDLPVGGVGAAPMLERRRPVHDGADAVQHAARRLALRAPDRLDCRDDVAHRDHIDWQGAECREGVAAQRTDHLVVVLGRAPTLAGIPGEGSLREGRRRRRHYRRRASAPADRIRRRARRTTLFIAHADYALHRARRSGLSAGRGARGRPIPIAGFVTGIALFDSGSDKNRSPVLVSRVSTTSPAASIWPP